MVNRRRLLLVLMTLLGLTLHVQAQSECGVVDSITYPIDTNQFTLVQDYGVVSVRHQGRSHTGEDWYGGRGTSYGQPVRAAARGRVSYSYGLGWGRDGGVVIIQHFLPDGSVFYTQYGHLMETDAYPLPTRLSCVEQGDIIGAVGDSRPAPHLHFEVRTVDGSTPGPGYTRERPYEVDYRNPGKFILNQQMWLSLWHEWHILVGRERPIDERGPLAPPLLLRDNSLLYLDSDGDVLRRATHDGRILWRALLETPAVAVLGWRGSSLLSYADGGMQQIDVETGGLGERWQLDAQFVGAPLEYGEQLIYPTAQGGLLWLAEDRRTILQQIDSAPQYVRAHVLPDGTLALLTAEHALFLLSPQGEELLSAQLQESASFATAQDGTLLVYAQGGYWNVDRAGEWRLQIEDAPPGGANSALLITEQRRYLFDGSRLIAYDAQYEPLWEASVPPMQGTVQLAQHEDILLLTSNHGQLAVVQEAGRFCNQARIFGGDQAQQWHALGSDGILRFAVADQLLGLDWDLFTRNCRL